MLYNFFKILEIKLRSGAFVYISFSDEQPIVKKDNNYYKSYKQIASTTSISRVANFGVDNSELNLLFQQDGIFTKEKFEIGLFNNAEFNIYLIDRDNYEVYNEKNGLKYAYLNNAKIDFTGLIGNFKYSYNAITIELRSVKQKLQATIINTIEKQCSNKFCDKKCKLNIDKYTYKTKIKQVLSLTSAIIEKPENINDLDLFIEMLYFSRLEMRSGLLNGYKLDIKGGEKISENEIKLHFNTNVKVLFQNDDECFIIAKCNKTKEMCKKLNNIENFSGFSYVPVKSKVYQNGTGNLRK